MLRTCQNLWSLVEGEFDTLCKAYDERKLRPLLEADVAGYAYHAILTRLDGDASCVHLDTRLVGPSGNEKYDLVIGECIDTEERRRLALERGGDNLPEEIRRFLASKAALSEFRPAVGADIILEFKFFATGFTPPQLREHLIQALKDVRKVGALATVCPEGRGIVLFDDTQYLTLLRQEQVVAARGADDRNLRIYLFQRDNAGEMKWRIL